VRDLEHLALVLERILAAGAEEPGAEDVELSVALGIEPVAPVARLERVGDAKAAPALSGERAVLAQVAELAGAASGLVGPRTQRQVREADRQPERVEQALERLQRHAGGSFLGRRCAEQEADDLL